MSMLFWKKPVFMQRMLAFMAAAMLWAIGNSAHAQQSSQLRIGYQKSASLFVLQRAQGSLEQKLQPLGVQVKWVEFPAGPQLLEGLNVGAIDVGFVGEAPPIFAQAAGAQFVYIGYDPAAPHAEAILVPKDSPIRSVADLKGRKVAFGKGSSAHNVTIKALAAAGLKPSDITQVFLSPADATAAFNGGNVDAWVVWDRYFAIAQQRYGARALVDTITQPSLASSSYYMANRDFAQKQGALLAEILKTLQQTTHWASANREELVQLASQDTGLDPEVWRTAYGRANLDLQPISTAHVAQQQQLADSFHALGIIPRKLQVQEIVWNWQV